MAASYVAVTAAAVILVEAVAIVAVLPNLFSRFDLEKRVSITASLVAAAAAKANSGTTSLRLPSGYMIGDPGADPVTAQPFGAGLAVPQIEGRIVSNPDGSPSELRATLAVLIDAQAVIQASSYPSRFPVGGHAETMLPIPKLIEGSGTAQSSDGIVTWAMEPVVLLPEKQVTVATAGSSKDKDGTVTFPGKVFVGWAYVQTPGTVFGYQPAGVPTLSALAALPDSSVGPLLFAGIGLLLLLIPIGTAFGIWTSRRLVTRLGALAGATSAFAGGALASRVPEHGTDEVGQLERGFNEMATRIEHMTTEQARLADERARTEERSRIARELHDSISQDLFSVNLIAGGLQRALPANSPLQSEISAMRGTIEGTMNEMRALLLELRPTALDERGLVPALMDLCAAYQERLGVTIDARLDPIEVAPPADHAVLRVAQEGIANAVRHADARHIGLELARRDGHTELVIADDGRGFDPSATTGYGLGLRVMRERLREMGGSLVVESEPGRGTRLVAAIPS